jgi:hypothetical protein
LEHFKNLHEKRVILNFQEWTLPGIWNKRCNI